MAILFRILALAAVPLSLARDYDCAPGERLRIAGETIRLPDRSSARAAIHVRGACDVEIANVTIHGNRAANPQSQPLPPYNVRFADHYRANGIQVEGARSLLISNSRLTEIAGFAILASGVGRVRIDRVDVTASGSTNAKGRNNTTGGILLEDGTANFLIENCRFENILGNALWTHSRYGATRNGPGVFRANRFDTVARDAIQVGHAFQVQVLDNTITNIGRPDAAVDIEGGGWAVGIDTAGDVSHSLYQRNVMTEMNGKCIDLDGFHHGEVTHNSCSNSKPAEAYAYGHFGIVFNNTNPDMQSVAIRVERNTIEGMRLGGIFVLGSGHVIRENRLTRINTSRCQACPQYPDQTAMLRSGIFLGDRAERAAATRGNRIENNLVSGWQMARYCIGLAPGVQPGENTIRANTCRNEGK